MLGEPVLARLLLHLGLEGFVLAIGGNIDWAHCLGVAQN